MSKRILFLFTFSGILSQVFILRNFNEQTQFGSQSKFDAKTNTIFGRNLAAVPNFDKNTLLNSETKNTPGYSYKSPLERVLTAIDGKIGNYVIKTSENIEKCCKNFREKEVLTFFEEEHLLKNHLAMKKKYPNGRSSLINTKIIDWGIANIFTLAMTIAFLVLSFIAQIFNIFWGCCFSWCKCCCRFCCCRGEIKDGKYTNPHEGCCYGKFCRYLVFFGSFMSVQGLCAVLFMWQAPLGTLVDKMPALNCGLSLVFGELLYGVENQYYTFAGIEGFNFLLSTARDEVAAVATMPYGQNILDRDIPSDYDLYETAQSNFYTAFKDKSFQNPVDRSTTITSGFISTLHTDINKGIETERKDLKTIGKAIYSTAKLFVKFLNGDDLKGFTDGIDEVLKMIKNAKKGVVDMDKMIASDFNFQEQLDLANANLQYFVLGLAGIGLFWYLMLSVTHICKSCQGACCMCLEKCHLIFVSFMAFFCSLIGVMVLLLTVILCQVCVFQHQAYHDKGFVTSNIAKHSKDMEKYQLTCVFPDSSGKINDVITGGGGGQFNETMDIFNGLTEFKQNFEPVYGNVSDGLSITGTKDYLSETKVFTQYDFHQEIYKGPKEAIDAINALLTCTNDKWVLTTNDCTSASHVWIAVNSAYTVAQQKAVCIHFKTFYDYGVINIHSIEDRYTGTCADNNTLNGLLNNLILFYSEYEAEILKMTGESGTEGLSSTNQIGYQFKETISKVKASTTDLEAYIDAIKNAYGFITEFQGNAAGFVNCRFLRRDMVVISNTLCYSFVFALDDFTQQLILIGPQFWLVSFFMCMTIRCPLLKKDQNKVKPQEKRPTMTSSLDDLESDKYVPSQENDNQLKYNTVMPIVNDDPNLNYSQANMSTLMQQKQQKNQMKQGRDVQYIQKKNHGLDI